MTGRGIDQILPFPSNPTLHESHVRDARRYIELAELTNGPIPRKVKPDYIWGDLLAALDTAKPDARIVNLETCITDSDDHWPGKGVNYRMHPRHIDCLTAAKIDCCCLANNHIIDWDYEGLRETLKTLDDAGLAHAGAGLDIFSAAAPAVIELPHNGRVLVFAYGHTSSGIPREWAARPDKPGVHLLPDISTSTARSIAGKMRSYSRPGDVIVASVHWGGNWGYELGEEERNFARTLIEHGIHVFHGHSSHHVKALEIHQNRPLLYGCGDFLNDYEGIRGHEMFRPDLTLGYLITLSPESGRMLDLRLLPMQLRNFQLRQAILDDAQWLAELLNRLASESETRVEVVQNHQLIVHWRGA